MAPELIAMTDDNTVADASGAGSSGGGGGGDEAPLSTALPTPPDLGALRSITASAGNPLDTLLAEKMGAIVLDDRPAWVDNSVILFPSLLSRDEATKAKAERKKANQLEYAVWNTAEEEDEGGFVKGGKAASTRNMQKMSLESELNRTVTWPTTYYLLLTTYCLSLTTYYLLLTTYHFTLTT